MAKIEPGHFVFISIPMGDAKFVTKKGRGGQAPILSTRNLGRYAPKFLAPAEGWWPSATDWQGIFFRHFILYLTRSLGRYAALLLAPAEGWWPLAT